MKLKHFSIVPLLFFINSIFCQDLEKVPIHYNADITTKHGAFFQYNIEYIKTVGKTDSCFYVHRKTAKYDTYLIKTNLQGDFISMKSLIFKPYKELIRVCREFIILENKLYAILFSIDKTNSIHSITAEEIDQNLLKGNGKVIELAQLKYNKSNDMGDFSIRPSPNMKKLLVYSELPDDRNKNQIFNLAIFDSSLNKEWASKIEINYDISELSIENCGFDNEDNIVIYAKEFRSSNENDFPLYDKNINLYYNIVIFFVDKQRNSIEELHLDVENKWLSKVKFSPQKNNKLMATGTYREKFNGPEIGLFTITVDCNKKKVINYYLKKFDLNFYFSHLPNDKKNEEIEKVEKNKSKPPTIENYQIEDIIQRPDGNTLLILEHRTYAYFYRIWFSNEVKWFSNIDDNVYKDLIVICLNTSDKIEWSVRVPKNQGLTDILSLSYAYHLRDNNLHLIFNSNQKNYSFPNGDNYKTYQTKPGIHYEIVYVTIDANGKMKGEFINPNSFENYTICPIYSIQLNENESLILNQKGNKKRFSVIKFN